MWGRRALRVILLVLVIFGGMGCLKNQYLGQPSAQRDDKPKLIPERIPGGII